MNPETVHKVLAVLDEQLEDSTWNLWLQRYQRLAKWLSDPDDDECPKLWRKIEFKKIDWNKKLKDKWLTEEEFYRLLEWVDNLRDKAFFCVGVEGGLRPGELLGICIKDCKHESYGFKVTVSGKTGTRTVPIVLFASILRNWLNHHPLKHDKDAPLWIQRSSYGFERISYSAMNKYHLKRYCALAGVYRWKTVVDKKTGQPKQINVISLHYLRHTKVTWTAKNRKVHIGIKQANEMFGWTQNSSMFLRYSHLAGQDSEDAFLALAGLKKDAEDKPSVLAQTKCLNCGELNSVGSMFCASCGYPLNVEAAEELLTRRRMEEDFRKMQPELNKLVQELLAKKASERDGK